VVAEDRLLEAIQADLEQLAGRSSDDPNVVCWKELDDELVESELVRLADWVDWLVERYCLDHKTIPPCWARHGALTEELSAIRTLWEVCYTGDAAPADPATFHRELDATLRRLREWSSIRGGSRTEHRDDTPPHG
jgi:hypothetical protein